MTRHVEPLPLPEDPTLAACAAALNEGGFWATVHDALGRCVFFTDEQRLSYADAGAGAVPLGCAAFSSEVLRLGVEITSTNLELAREQFVGSPLPGYMLAGNPEGRECLRRLVDPVLADLVDELEAEVPPPAWIETGGLNFAGGEVAAFSTWITLRDSSGKLAGYCCVTKPAVGMSELATVSAMADPTHLERLRVVESPSRHPAAILMADLEASSPLARRLSTVQFFSFIRRLVRAADHAIIDDGGIVGRHAGDGVVAFFLAETSESESAAARSCIEAARRLRGVLAEVAQRSEIPPSELSLRFGLHWGATLYMGRIQTRGRSEVTALGDEMNETARIEACATNGRALASKSLVERLNQVDADTVGLDHRHLSYTPLAELASATDKARRDAPSIAVCEI